MTNYRARGDVNLPICDNVRTRQTGFYGNYDGNIRNTVQNTRLNGYEHYGCRSILAAGFSPTVHLTIIGD